MQHKHIFSLLDDSFTTVTVVFGKASIVPVVPKGLAKDITPRWSGQSPEQAELPATYTYKAPKDSGLQPGDAVVVDSPRNGLVIARIDEVHDYPKLDLDSDIEYKWVVQKIDMTDYLANLERETKFREAMVDVERAKQREEFVTNFIDNLPAGSEARRAFDQAMSFAKPILQAPTTNRPHESKGFDPAGRAGFAPTDSTKGGPSDGTIHGD